MSEYGCPSVVSLRLATGTISKRATKTLYPLELCAPLEEDDPEEACVTGLIEPPTEGDAEDETPTDIPREFDSDVVPETDAAKTPPIGTDSEVEPTNDTEENGPSDYKPSEDERQEVESPQGLSDSSREDVRTRERVLTHDRRGRAIVNYRAPVG